MKKIYFLVIAVLFVSSNEVIAQSPKKAKVLTAVSSALILVDGVDTYFALKNHNFKEANPLLPKSGGKILIIQSGLAVANLWLGLKFADKHPKIVFWTNVGVSATRGAVISMNFSKRF